ncbi:unnamed protein product [Lactuca virosa]|uniref:Uncharacterized protein n=1 Tax=Lactuca virosa TaxID=75947 RepID=A0AAU9M917_9ASTR|nr:unnamed protein product [Lactuca virosa]
MTNTFLHYQSIAEKFLLSSTKFWSTISTVAAIAGLSSFFYSTHEQYTNSFNNSGRYICAFIIIALHFIIFFSDPQKLKVAIAPFFPGSAMKWTLRFTAMRVIYVFLYVPEKSVVVLIFSICVWIDIIAITRIIKPSIDLWVTNSVFIAVVSRSIDLYGFTVHHWLIMLLCYPVMFVQFRLEGYKDEETKEKEG